MSVPQIQPPQPSEVELRAFINGTYVDVTGDEAFPLHNPATEELFLTLEGAGPAEVDAAVQAAKEAQPAWAARSAYERVELVRAFAKLLTRDAPKLAPLETVVTGKQLSVQLGPTMEVWINGLAALALSTPGQAKTLADGTLGITSYHPFGVVACLMPFNGPSGKLAMSVLPALLAGNAVVVKASERNPLATLAYGRLFKEAGFPDGVINILPGGGKPGALLAEHMQVRLITFTGSVGVGKQVVQAAARSNLKKVVLELGGKSPSLVFEDADIATAVGSLSVGLRFLAGQVCIANSRIYVQESIAEAFQKAFLEHHFSHKPSDPWDLQGALGSGPVVDQRAHESINSFIDSARAEGGTVHQGDQKDGKGYYVPPTIITGLSEDAKAVKQEIFGNVAHLSTFKTEEEAIRLANDTEYGLYASVFTSNTDRAIRCSRALDAGTVVVNGAAPTLDVQMPFGGTKQSGWGKEMGPDAIRHFMEEKSVFFKCKAA